MSIETRLAFTTSICFVVAALIAGFLSYRVEIGQAHAEINAQAEVLIEAASAVRHYTNDQVSPLLTDLASTAFLPQQVPAFSAQMTMLNLRERYPQFQYREASVNPTNTNDRASDWEAGLLRQLRSDASLKELVGEHGSGSSARYFIARPLRVESPACLRCHSVPEAAPRSMVTKYGAANGFGWQLGDVVALQIVDVPTAPTRQKAFNSVTVTVGSIAATFALIQVILTLLIKQQITRPLALLSNTARALSLGQAVPDIDRTALPREFDELRDGLTRLSRSLALAKELGQAGGADPPHTPTD